MYKISMDGSLVIESDIGCDSLIYLMAAMRLLSSAFFSRCLLLLLVLSIESVFDISSSYQEVTKRVCVRFLIVEKFIEIKKKYAKEQNTDTLKETAPTSSLYPIRIRYSVSVWRTESIECFIKGQAFTKPYDLAPHPPTFFLPHVTISSTGDTQED
jgi:hypothetical protein